MKIFDGSNERSVIKSLANTFNISDEEIKCSIREFYLTNKERLENINSYYDEFIDFINFSEPEEEIVFDYIYFFHIMSSIDNLQSIKEFGVIDLKESLIKRTTLRNYLEENNINFQFNEQIELIVNGKKNNLAIFDSEDFCEDDYWKYFYGQYLYHRLNFDYNINGFLFKYNIYSDKSYSDLKNKSEFLDRLGDFLNNKDVVDKWEKLKKSFFLRCKIQTEKVTLGDGLTWPTLQETSKKIINRALYYLVELERDKRELPPTTYILINYGISIPYKDIEVFDYNIER